MEITLLNFNYWMRASIKGNCSDICKAFALKSVQQFYILRYFYCKIDVFLINNL